MFGYDRLFLYGDDGVPHVFKHFNPMFKWLADRNTNKLGNINPVKIYTNAFNVIQRYYKDEPQVKIGGKTIGVKVRDIFHIYDAAFKVGSNEFKPQELLDLIPVESRWNSGFNGELRKVLSMDDIKKKFPPISKELRTNMIKNEIRCGPIIYCQSGKEYVNPYSYDIKSAYVYWLINSEFPTKFIKTTYRRKGALHYCKVKIKGLKAKITDYNPLFAPRNDEGAILQGTRLIAAQEYEGFVYYELFYPMLKRNYDFESVEIDKNELYMCETSKLPDETIESIKELFDIKEQTKQLKYKIRLNRVFGLFITKRFETGDVVDYTVPYQVGTFIMNLQGFYMDSVIHKCGIEHLVRAHTDSIMFDCDIHETIYEENNRRHMYKGIGMWVPEQYAKWTAYSNTRAKYVDKNGHTGIKHGSINQFEVDRFLKVNDYDSINQASEIRLIKGSELIEDERGTHIRIMLTKSRFGKED